MKSSLQIPGLHESLRVYYFSDTHLQATSPGNPALPESWRENPKPILPCSSQDLLRRHLERAWKAGANLILHGGDLCHFPSPENRDLALELFREFQIPWYAVPGNHDWYYPGQDGWEALRERQLPLLSPLFGHQPSMWCERIQGLRILGVDNSCYFLNTQQLHFLERELQDPSPCILMMHIPLSLPEFRAPVIAKHGHPIMMADPEERLREGIDPEATRKAAALIRSAPGLKLLLSAHVHLPLQGEVRPGLAQLVPEAAYRDGYYLLDLIPAAN